MSNSKGKIDSVAFLENLSKMLAQNAGKDKIAKILQYGGKLVAAHLSQSNPKSEGAAQAKKIEASAGGARKVFRLGNELAEFHKIRATLVAPNPLDPVNILSFFRGMGMFWYWIFDHVVWLGNINAAKVDTQKYSWNSSVAWFIGLVSTILIDLNSLFVLLRKEKHLQIVHWQEQDRSQLQQQVKEIKAKKSELYLNFVKNIADLAIASHLLQIRILSPKKIGVFGLISALIASYQLFPALPTSK